MIIIDMNQITVASLMMHLNMTKSKEPDENIVRHMILNSVRMYRTQFTEEYGEVVLAYDSKHYWRRDFFPNYKASRRKGREKSDLDWDAIFEVLNKIKAEFKDNLPYKYLEVYGAEADDIIATLVKNKKEPIMIVSGDKDFIQLQKYSDVKQYSPILKKYVNGYNPDTYIKEHILKGDTSDGVPNVLSPDNTFVDGLRQKPLTKKKIESWLNANIDDLPDEVKRNYQRNETLISLDKIPSELETEINEVFDNAPCGNRSKLLNYFIQSRLKNLTETIGEF
jgi:5'-3' exonuclease|tara:strand:+ start:1309 stop:2148 length:840 start_codon:yes stop_codon:yes gene_type:complete